MYVSEFYISLLDMSNYHFNILTLTYRKLYVYEKEKETV